jgi:hypothetical protein
VIGKSLDQTDRGCGMDLDVRDAGGGGRLCFQVLNKSLQSWFTTFQVNLNSFLAVQYPSGEGIGACETIDEGAEANALHNAANSDRAGTCHRYSTSTMQLRPCQPI